ncbi:hypothetical protein ACQCSX_17050 [Pseudarthrobacter sp. P1]|uniref:hypothetical protein n=1 Tax=Pseudarthrobacter sp. P1 TaxID=3418418 RepID=UPI003CEAF32B
MNSRIRSAAATGLSALALVLLGSVGALSVSSAAHADDKPSATAPAVVTQPAETTAPAAPTTAAPQPSLEPVEPAPAPATVPAPQPTATVVPDEPTPAAEETATDEPTTSDSPSESAWPTYTASPKATVSDAATDKPSGGSTSLTDVQTASTSGGVMTWLLVLLSAAVIGGGMYTVYALNKESAGRH